MEIRNFCFTGNIQGYSTIRKRLIYIYKPVDQWWDFYVSSD